MKKMGLLSRGRLDIMILRPGMIMLRNLPELVDRHRDYHIYRMDSFSGFELNIVEKDERPGSKINSKDNDIYLLDV